MRDPKDYNTFIYYYEGMYAEEPEIPSIEQISIIAKSHSNIEIQSYNIELHERELHIDIEVE